MQTYLKSRPVWSQSLIFISLVVAMVLLFVAMIGTWIGIKLTGLSLFEISDVDKWTASDPRYVVFLRVMLAVQFVGLFVAPCLLFAYFSDPKPARYLGLKKTSPLFFISGILVMIAAIPLVEYLGLLNQKITFPHSIEGWMKNAERQAQQQVGMLLQSKSISNLILNVIMVAGFAGVGEELFFRGVLQRLAIWSFKNVWAGIIVAAALFSALHLQFYGFFPRFFLGILLGAIMWYSGSIWPAMLAHFFYDATLIVLAYFNPGLITEDQTSFIPSSSMAVLALVSAAATIALLWFMRSRSTADAAQFLAERKPYSNDPFTFDQDGAA